MAPQRISKVCQSITGRVDFKTFYLIDYQKHSNFVPFPHVGRNDAEIRKFAHFLALQQALDKRSGPSASSGLWFGPRLGKRSVNAKDYPAASKGQKEVY